MRRIVILIILAALVGAAPAGGSAPFLVGSGRGPVGNPQIGFGWVASGRVISHVPLPQFQYNSSGATNTVIRIGIGTFDVLLPELSGSHGGTVFASSLTTGMDCKVVTWTAFSEPVRVRVRCFDALGNRRDSRFTVGFTNDTDRVFMAWADRPGTAVYLPNLLYQHGVGVTPVLIRQEGVGVTTVTLEGNDYPMAVKVTAVGEDATRCNAGKRWTPEVLVTRVRVVCRTPAGDLVDSEYTIQLTPEISLFGGLFLEDGWAYANRQTEVLAYSPMHYSSKPGGGARVKRVGPGRYELRLADLGPAGFSSTVHVSPVSLGGHRCQVPEWRSGAQGGLRVVITCQNAAGVPANTRFVVHFARAAVPLPADSTPAELVEAVVVDPEVVGDLVDDGDRHLLDDLSFGIAHGADG